MQSRAVTESNEQTISAAEAHDAARGYRRANPEAVWRGTSAGTPAGCRHVTDLKSARHDFRRLPHQTTRRPGNPHNTGAPQQALQPHGDARRIWPNT